MIEIFYRLLDSADSVMVKIEQLYTSAFPPDERRDFADFKALLADAAMPFAVIGAFDKVNPDRLLAFVSYWQFGDISYIEHFAVIGEMRGRGVGSSVLRHFVAEVSPSIVLEVEPPVTPVAVKRIDFYRSLGLKLWSDVHYVQPAYAPDKQPLEMKLMTHGDVMESQLMQVVGQMRRLVYGCGSVE